MELFKTVKTYLLAIIFIILQKKDNPYATIEKGSRRHLIYYFDVPKVLG